MARIEPNTTEASKGVASVKNGAANLADGAGAVFGAARDALVGGGGGAKKAAGGLLGLVKETGDKMLRIAGGAMSITGKTMKAFPGVTALVVAGAAAIGIKGYLDKRAKNKELETMRSANELGETTLANNALEAQVRAQGAMPQFDNPDARNDFVARQAAAKPQLQQQGATR